MKIESGDFIITTSIIHNRLTGAIRRVDRVQGTRVYLQDLDGNSKYIHEKTVLFVTKDEKIAEEIVAKDKEYFYSIMKLKDEQHRTIMDMIRTAIENQ